MPKRKRKKLFVDRPIQVALLQRVLLYWFCCLLFITIPILIGRTLSDPSRLFYEQLDIVWDRYWPVFSAAALMLPFVAYDMLRLSHRFVGPILRLRREMARLAAGEAVGPLRFRDNDYWHDLTDSFSQIAERLQVVEHATCPREDLATADDTLSTETSPEPIESA